MCRKERPDIVKPSLGGIVGTNRCRETGSPTGLACFLLASRSILPRHCATSCCEIACLLNTTQPTLEIADGETREINLRHVIYSGYPLVRASRRSPARNANPEFRIPISAMRGAGRRPACFRTSAVAARAAELPRGKLVRTARSVRRTAVDSITADSVRVSSRGLLVSEQLRQEDPRADFAS